MLILLFPSGVCDDSKQCRIFVARISFTKFCRFDKVSSDVFLNISNRIYGELEFEDRAYFSLADPITLK